MSTAEVLEMDPTVACVVATTVPSITVWIWVPVLMHWTWCHAPLFRPEPPVALWLLVVPRKVHWICPDCSSSTLYSGAVNTPLRTRSKSPDLGREKVLSHREMVMLAEPGLSEPELGTST